MISSIRHEKAEGGTCGTHRPAKGVWGIHAGKLGIVESGHDGGAVGLAVEDVLGSIVRGDGGSVWNIDDAVLGGIAKREVPIMRGQATDIGPGGEASGRGGEIQNKLWGQSSTEGDAGGVAVDSASGGGGVEVEFFGDEIFRTVMEIIVSARCGVR